MACRDSRGQGVHRVDTRLETGVDGAAGGAGLSAQAVVRVVVTARGVVGWLVGGLTGLVDEHTAERNAREATCADLLRRSGGTP